MKKKKRSLNRNIAKVLCIGIIAFSIYLLYGVANEVYSTVQLKKRREIAEIELERLKDENALLLSKKTKLEDPNYVQTYARGNYMFSKDGEQIFYLPSDLDREPTAEVTEPAQEETDSKQESEANAETDSQQESETNEEADSNQETETEESEEAE